MQLVSVEGLYVARGNNPVLRDVELSASQGEIVAIVGGNGSGKSTLLSAIVGLLPVQEGRISLFNQPISQFKDWHRIGYVPQHSAINTPIATVKEIVSTGRLCHRLPFQPLGKKDKQAIDDALEVVGLSDRANWPFTALSGGQKQRTLIARALCCEPDLFVMDEPMAGVDLHSQAGLANILDNLTHNSDRGLLVVLHEIGAMKVDRKIKLCDGRVVSSTP